MQVTGIRVGIIGVGDRGLELLNQIRACDNAEVVAFADIYTKRLEKAASFAPNAATFTDYPAVARRLHPSTP